MASSMQFRPATILKLHLWQPPQCMTPSMHFISWKTTIENGPIFPHSTIRFSHDFQHMVPMDYIQSQQGRYLATNGNFDYKWEEIKMDEHQWWFPKDWCVSNLYSSSSPLISVTLFLMMYFSKIIQESFELNILKIYIVVVSCCSRLASYCLACRPTFLHSEVSANSTTQTLLSHLERKKLALRDFSLQPRLARMEHFDSGKSLTCLVWCSFLLRWARWLAWGSHGENDDFWFCFSIPKPRCWLAGRAFISASLDARLVNKHDIFFLDFCSNLS